MVQVIEHNRLIGELQALDVAQRIGTLVLDAATGPVVGHRNNVLTAGADKPGCIHRPVEGEAVVRQRPIELRGIKVRRGRILELTHDLQLARVVEAGHHGGNEIHHAVDAGEFHIVIGQAAHADAHVQPSITIDQVVAALTHDDVAAFTAEDDVAAAELADVRGGPN
jgi:hypothetical protein